MKSFFILGSNPTLSIAEIAAVLGYDLDFSECSKEVLLLDTDMNLGELLDRLGGTIKVGHLIGTMPNLNLSELADLIAATVAETQGKVNFGLSVYRLDDTAVGTQNFVSLQRSLESIGLEVKKRLKEQKRSARFVYNKEPVLATGSIKENKLLESGGEMVLIAGADGIQIGQTAAVQDFEAWSHRDYDKPARDMKRGMIPPKLARMMVNIALGTSQIANRASIRDDVRRATSHLPITLLDPFCGVGTILMEARLVEVDFVIGSDIDEVAIEATAKNLSWFEREFGVDVSSVELVQCKAEEINACLPRELVPSTATHPNKLGEKYIDVVVTEPYLGPPQKGRETKAEIDKIVKDLTKLYIDSLKAIVKTLKPGARVVIALPVFMKSNRRQPSLPHERAGAGAPAYEDNIFMPVLKKFKQLGLSLVDPVPSTAPESVIKKTPRGGILYQRKDQMVGREIILLKYS
ncbi:hypothetical protein KJ910_03445 [Patescibacteria group bacterium]|nr:hypothetical protein [Patescibacteria group bacterium]MBU1706041.1 hypothetical protein [Patescibacteria group bacterium]MBU1907180.1 hypothetical protein [Patescibacteria group bacterium]